MISANKKKKKKGLGFADDSVDKLSEKTESLGGTLELSKTIGIYLFLLRLALKLCKYLLLVWLCCCHFETVLACSLAVSDEEVLNDENDSWEDIDGNIFLSCVFSLVKNGNYVYCNAISILASSYTYIIIFQRDKT